MPVQLDRKVRNFQQIKAKEKQAHQVHDHAPGAAQMNGHVLEGPRFKDHMISAQTLATNVAAWREKRELNVDSVKQSMDECLIAVRREFPAVEDLNTALNIRRWSKAMKRRKARQQAVDPVV